MPREWRALQRRRVNRGRSESRTLAGGQEIDER
jgi:hypothetical protein